MQLVRYYGHDLTQIIKDKRKGRLFERGISSGRRDIPVLLSMGKDHIYVSGKR